jgi:signal transduction histidine kinase
MIDINMEIIRYQRLASLGRDLEGFVHNAAGPMNIILGYVQVLRAKYSEEKSLEKVWEAGMELDRSLKDLMAHLENSQQILDAPVNINEMILRHIELLRANNFFKHNVEAVTDLTENLPVVWGKYGDIMICLDVILNNAINAVIDSSVKKIVVKTDLVTQNEQKKVKITVRDTGEGFEDEKSKRYFELGYSGWSNSRKSNGVGLCLAKYIMDQTGGGIKLKDSCGCGAEAVLLLPLRDKDAV